MTRLLPCLLALSLVDAAALDTARADDWPSWRGQNQNSTASSKGRIRHGLRLAWKMPLGPGYSGVSIAEGRTVTLFSDGGDDQVIAFDAASGKELWRHRIAATYRGHTGSHDGPLSTPLLADGQVFVLGPRGELLALSAADGRELWSVHLVDDLGATEPDYGFTASPALESDVVILATGGSNGRAFSGFDRRSGKVLWSTGSAVVDYQSSVMVDLAGRRQLLGVGRTSLRGLDPVTGKELWVFRHDGNWVNTNPVLIDANTLLVDHKWSEALLLRLTENADGFHAEEIWRTNAFKTYGAPVLHDGFLYGYSNRFVVCVDAETGEAVWKSRPPGDGFLILVDDRLVIVTRRGVVHVAAASSEGYQELSSLAVFDDTSWTPPSFAGGRIYVRGMSEIASIETRIGSKAAPVADRPNADGLPAADSMLAQLVRRVEEARDKTPVIDAFMAAQRSFPVVEHGRLVHVVYRGPARDVAVTGDPFFGAPGYFVNDQRPMHRIDGTDFFYYTFELEPDARVEYQLVVDLQDPGPDPLNPTQEGVRSELSLPGFARAPHLDGPSAGTRGRLETFDLASDRLEDSRTIQVYLPSGYDGGQARYPVLYVPGAEAAVAGGRIVDTFDHLIHSGGPSFVAVLIEQKSWRDFGARRADYAAMMIEELVPRIESSYPVATDPSGRAVLGAGDAGFITLLTVLRHPGVFGQAASQSAYLQPEDAAELKDLIRKATALSTRLYLEWGKYDRRTGEGNLDVPEAHRELAKLLRAKGIEGLFQEVHTGWGWGSWRHRTGEILKWLF